MNRIVRLWLLIAFCLAWPAASHAQDRAQITRVITYSLTNIALIERERARPDVPDDFAEEPLALARQRLAENYALADRSGQGRAIRQEAGRIANRTIGATPRTDYLRSYLARLLRYATTVARVEQRYRLQEVGVANAIEYARV